MAIRTIYLVRHGQYVAANALTGTEECLTRLGRQQALRIGRRLRELRLDVMYQSNMPRALETADIIATCLPPLRRITTPILREGLPSVAAHFDPRFRPPRAKVLETRKRMDEAFARFVKPTTRDRNELLVAHGNIIRYFMRKVLGDAATRWWQMDTIQCGLSVIRVVNERRVFVAFNDVGHLPLKMRTHS